MSSSDSFRIIQDFIPMDRSNRPGYEMDPDYITVHETANTDVGANAERHAAYVKATGRLVSWHFTIDSGDAIYQHLPLDESGYHAGDGSGDGNRNSIGIELCVNSDGDFAQTRINAAAFIANLMEEHEIPLANVRTHHSWSQKDCPANLLHDWQNFLQQIAEAGGIEFEEPGDSDQDENELPDGERRVLRLQTPYMRGADVRELQEALVRNNFYPDRHAPNGGVDGVFGPKTQDAVRRYQIMNGLTVDGIAGPKTYASLGLTDPVEEGDQEGEENPSRRVLRLQTPYMRGTDVRELQEALVRNNFYPDRYAPNGGVDGAFGPKTQDAVRRYQIMNGLTVDGIAGPETFRALGL